MPGVVARASRALAFGNAEQAASLSKAAGSRTAENRHLLAKKALASTNSIYMVEKWGSSKVLISQAKARISAAGGFQAVKKVYLHFANRDGIRRTS